MTKFIEQRVDELEKQVAKLELIIHELRGKKSIDPSTTNTVEDFIEFEGQQYRKVDREAREGDYVSVSFENGKCFKPNKLYGPAFFEDKRLRVKADPSSGGEYEITQVYHDLYGRTPETVDVYELMKEGLNPQIPIVDETIEPLTPNQQRAAIIEKAEKFIWDSLKGQYYTVPGRVISFSNTHGYRARHDFEFIVNTDKRTIVALILDGDYNNRVCQRGIAKCDPNDVFNEHIGKAIALGRALGLNVSEFEQAVQPTLAVGQIVYHRGWKETCEIAVSGHYLTEGSKCAIDSTYARESTIINDTDAIYGGVE